MGLLIFEPQDSVGPCVSACSDLQKIHVRIWGLLVIRLSLNLELIIFMPQKLSDLKHPVWNVVTGVILQTYLDNLI
jgi:hypothetical protein